MKVNTTIFLTIISFFYNVLLMIAFFSKDKIKTLENKVYSKLIIINFIGIILELFCTVLAGYAKEHLIFYTFLNKLFLIELTIWCSVFSIYVFLISSKKEKDDLKLYLKRVTIFHIIIDIIVMTLILVLPVQFNINDLGYVMYSYGSSVDIVFGSSTLYIILMFICLIKNFKNIKSKKYLPIYAYMVIGVLVVIVQKLDPEILAFTSMETFITVIMYFTIENPDVKLIKELTLTNELLEKEKDATINSMNILSSSIDNSLTKLLQFGNKKYDNDEEFIREKEEIQKYSINLVNEVKGVIELSKIESGKYPLKNYKYDTKELFEEIEELFNIKASNDKIKITYDIDNNIHPVLSGDDEKIKETLVSLYNTIMSNFEVKDIVLRLKVSELGLVSRMKFSMIIDNGSSDKLDNYEDKLNGLEYNILKKLVKLQKIKFSVDNIDNKLEFSLTINQRIERNYHEVKTTNRSKKVEYFDLSNKNILLVDDNKDKINNLILLLEPYHINIVVAYDYLEFTNLLYGDNHYDLILLDDMMPDTSEFYWLNPDFIGNVDIKNKIKRMAGYNPNVVVMLTNGNILEEKYKTCKLDYILKPLDNSKLNKILRKYFK